MAFEAWTSGTNAPPAKSFMEKYLWAIILGGVLLLVLLLVIVVVIICCCCRRRKSKEKGKKNPTAKDIGERGTSELDVTLVSNGHNGPKPVEESAKKASDNSTKNVHTARAASVPVPINHGVEQEASSNKEAKNSHRLDSAHTPQTPPSEKQGTDKTQISDSDGANVAVIAASSTTAVDQSRKGHSAKGHSAKGHSRKGHSRKGHSKSAHVKKSHTRRDNPDNPDQEGKDEEEESDSSECSCSNASLSTKPSAKKPDDNKNPDDTKTKDSMYLVRG